MQALKTVSAIILILVLIALLMIFASMGASIIVFTAYVWALLLDWDPFQVWVYSIGAALITISVFMAMIRWEKTKKIRWWIYAPLESFAFFVTLSLVAGFVNLIK